MGSSSGDRGSGRVLRGGAAAEHEHEARALQADEHVSASVAGGAAQLIHVDGALGAPNEHRGLAVAVPAEGGDSARKLVIRLAREDRVDDERLEPGVPEAAGLGVRARTRRPR